MARKFNVYLDERIVGEVKNNKTTEIEVEAGEYMMKTGISAINGMSHAINVNLSEEGSLTVETGYSMKACLIYFLIDVVGFIFLFTRNFFFALVGIAFIIAGTVYYFKNAVYIRPLE